MFDSPFSHLTEGISLRQLRLFEAIGDFNSVRRASEECSLSQPAVTQSLSKLEQQISTVLVERTSGGSFLNHDGSIFHARTRRFFEQAIGAIFEVGAAEDDEHARLILNRLTRAQIRALLAVLDNGGIPQAAEELGITVASLQRSARDLEANLGITLFHRTAMGVLVNPKGMELGRKLKIALQEIELGLEEIAELRGVSQRQMTIGGLPLGGSVLLAGVLDSFITDHPQTRLKIMSESASEMMDSLISGDVDFVVGLLPDGTSEGLACEPLARTPYAIVGRQGHPLLASGTVTREKLGRYDWIVGTVGSSRRAFYDRIFEGIPHPRSSITTSSPPIIRRMLAESDRLTLMTSYELHSESNLCEIPFAGVRDAPSIGVISRAGWHPTRLHAAFIEKLRNYVTQPETVESLRM